MNLSINLNSELKKYIAPEVITDFKIINKILDTFISNNQHEYNKQEMRYIIHSYSLLLLLRRYQRVKTKKVISVYKQASPEFFLFALPIERIIISYKSIFLNYALSSETGRWLLGVKEIGPQSAFLLLTYGMFEIKKGRLKTAGNMWDCFGLGVSFTVKSRVKRYSALPLEVKDFLFRFRNSIRFKRAGLYSDIYLNRLQYEIEKNEKGKNLAYIKIVESNHNKNYKQSKNLKKCIETGKLENYMLHNRAIKYALKVFLAHFHHVCYIDLFKKLPPKPYILSSLGSSCLKDQIPNYPFDL